MARDGAIDWLCLPNLDSPSVFAAILDAARGGRFWLSPAVPFTAERRYLPDTNVLETTFRTAEGVARITDAMTLPDRETLNPLREIARRVEGVSGRVPMRWRLEPRFGYAQRRTERQARDSIQVFLSGRDALALSVWEAGAPEPQEDGLGGRFEIEAGRRALLSLQAAHQEPLVFPRRGDVEHRLDRTVTFWREWTGGLDYAGPWRDAVVRSALALKLLVHAPSGAVAAAATTSLPEGLGLERNWDYRFCWIRDASFTLYALMQMGCFAEAHAYFWWFMHATRLTRPRLQVLYTLNGGPHAPERTLDLEGYRGTRPVRLGNGAAGQLQLDIYGALLEAAWAYATNAGPLDPETMGELARVADLVCRIWRQPDCGIWEVRSPPRHFTHSKLMCWVALRRALQMAERSPVATGSRHRWEREARAIADFIEQQCWSDARGSYSRSAGSDELDAAVLLMPIMGYGDPQSGRFNRTLDAIRRHLGYGAWLRRYSGDDGLAGREGAFITCSFWMVHALALAGRLDEAVQAMDDLIGRANDVGLFAEEIAPETGEFLGNFPQALVHLALINAAEAIQRQGAPLPEPPEGPAAAPPAAGEPPAGSPEKEHA